MSEETARNGGFEYRESGGYDRAQVDSFINEVKKYIAGQKNEKQLLTQKLHVLAVKIQEYQNLEKEQGTLADRNSALKAEAEALEAGLSELNAKKAETEAELAAKTEALSSEVGAMEEKLEAEKSELAAVEKKLGSAKNEAFSLDAAIKAKKLALADYEAKIASLAAEENRILSVNAEEINSAAESAKAAVSERLMALGTSVAANIAEIKGILENAAVVNVALVKAEESAVAAPVEEAPVEEVPAEEPAAEEAEEEAPAEAPVFTVEDLLAEDEAEETEPTDEELRSSRDTAKSILRSVTGADAEDEEDGPTKLMPDSIADIKLDTDNANSVGIVINAPAAEEESGWCAPEGSADDADEPIEAEAPAAEEIREETPAVTVLTAEEAEGLSYDDALALVMKKNGIDYNPPAKKTEAPVTAFAEEQSAKPEEPVEVDIPLDDKPKKEKKGFFAALKRNIDAILEDDDDEEDDDEFNGTEVFVPENKKAKNSDDRSSLRFGRDK